MRGCGEKRDRRSEILDSGLQQSNLQLWTIRSRVRLRQLRPSVLHILGPAISVSDEARLDDRWAEVIRAKVSISVDGGSCLSGGVVGVEGRP